MRYLHGVQLLLFGVQLFLSFSKFSLSDHQTDLLQGQVSLHTHTHTHLINPWVMALHNLFVLYILNININNSCVFVPSEAAPPC